MSDYTLYVLMVLFTALNVSVGAFGLYCTIKAITGGRIQFFCEHPKHYSEEPHTCTNLMGGHIG